MICLKILINQTLDQMGINKFMQINEMNEINKIGTF